MTRLAVQDEDDQACHTYSTSQRHVKGGLLLRTESCAMILGFVGFKNGVLTVKMLTVRTWYKYLTMTPPPRTPTLT